MNLIGLIGLMLAVLAGPFMVPFKKTRLVGMVLMVSAMAFGCFQWRKEERWSRGFDAVPAGATASEVMAIMGRPTLRAPSENPPFGYSLASRNKQVRDELWYVSFFFPQEFTFGLNEQGGVIDRYHFVSP